MNINAQSVRSPYLPPHFKTHACWLCLQTWLPQHPRGWQIQHPPPRLPCRLDRSQYGHALDSTVRKTETQRRTRSHTLNTGRVCRVETALVCCLCRQEALSHVTYIVDVCLCGSVRQTPHMDTVACCALERRAAIAVPSIRYTQIYIIEISLEGLYSQSFYGLCQLEGAHGLIPPNLVSVRINSNRHPPPPQPPRRILSQDPPRPIMLQPRPPDGRS